MHGLGADRGSATPLPDQHANLGGVAHADCRLNLDLGVVIELVPQTARLLVYLHSLERLHDIHDVLPVKKSDYIKERQDEAFSQVLHETHDAFEGEQVFIGGVSGLASNLVNA